MLTAGRPAERPAHTITATLLLGPLLSARGQLAGETCTSAAADEPCVATASPAPSLWEGDDDGLEGALTRLLAGRLDLGSAQSEDAPLLGRAGVEVTRPRDLADDEADSDAWPAGDGAVAAVLVLQSGVTFLRTSPTRGTSVLGVWPVGGELTTTDRAEDSLSVVPAGSMR